jgi:hypothetical protein
MVERAGRMQPAAIPFLLCSSRRFFPYIDRGEQHSGLSVGPEPDQQLAR